MDSNSTSKSQSPIPPIQIPPPSTPTPAPAVVAVSVPVVATDDTYVYIALKASLYGQDCSVFGLNDDEIRAIFNRFHCSSTQIPNGFLVKSPVIPLLNSLSQLGYKVVCTTGEAEIVWTMQREI